jgi:thymidylate kinase
MSKPLRSIIIEGIDRTGKSSLINGIQHELGFFQRIHFQKPELLETYLKDARIQLDKPPDALDDAVKAFAYKKYQADSFTNMFRALSSPARLILDRAHLGEAVYAHRYRGYSGDFVFTIEKELAYAEVLETTMLILLHTSSFEFIQDDGESFDFSKKEEEQNDFIRAFEKSKFKHKMMVDVSFEDKFAPAEKIAKAVTRGYHDLPGHVGKVWYVGWQANGENIISQNHLGPDPAKGVL